MTVEKTTIQAHELRIGNWVYLDFVPEPIAGKVLTIWQNQIETDAVSGYVKPGFGHVKPIPLTPEILEKCGFVRVDNDFHHNWQMRGRNESYSVQEQDGEYLFSNDYSDAGCYVITDVKYLHELQNLFFAISKTELNIQL